MVAAHHVIEEEDAWIKQMITKMKQLVFLDTIIGFKFSEMFCNLTSRYNPFFNGYQHHLKITKNIKILIKDSDDGLMVMIASFLFPMIIIVIIMIIHLIPCLHLQG